MSLEFFLSDKPLYYTEIDYTRMPRVYEKIKSHFTQTNTIHIVGTNGKGTTGRFLATALHNMGYKTAHYTSPHILEFNERIWMDGKNVSDVSLQATHEKLQTLLTREDSDSLSFFEYTTLLARLVFNDCDYIVLEAGLGGIHDATAVFPKRLTLVTPIAYDHESFLGSDISSIAREKLGAVQNIAIMAKQKYIDIDNIAQSMIEEKNIAIYALDTFIKKQDLSNIKMISKELELVKYLEDNLKLAMACLNFLKLPYKSEYFKNSKLFGRLTYFRDNIIVDVGHNPLAAKSILNALNGKKYTLVYNTYKDKDYKKILQILKPIIKNVEIINIKGERIEAIELLQTTLTDLEIKYKTFKVIDTDKKYLVFGSFSVVEEFLQRMRESSE
ncbi:MAG: dihydrofolate synthase/folylpolyglutamate synthase [Sulfurimonas sp.]|jgi:dihydrofolate synthase/folylpolyglutamate synthase|uniref:bifunctional folylpolyglutamate synthase/dihydrofolate synthase n=1 Tax=Sulfurimonas sp. TaxID=2022749 RepID=UPI0039E4B9DB